MKAFRRAGCCLLHRAAPPPLVPRLTPLLARWTNGQARGSSCRHGAFAGARGGFPAGCYAPIMAELRSCGHAVRGHDCFPAMLPSLGARAAAQTHRVSSVARLVIIGLDIRADCLRCIRSMRTIWPSFARKRARQQQPKTRAFSQYVYHAGRCWVHRCGRALRARLHWGKRSKMSAEWCFFLKKNVQVLKTCRSGRVRPFYGHSARRTQHGLDAARGGGPPRCGDTGATGCAGL